jgi:hypothetical protein
MLPLRDRAFYSGRKEAINDHFCSCRSSPFARTLPVIISRRNLEVKSKSDWKIKPERLTLTGRKEHEANRKLSQN